MCAGGKDNWRFCERDRWSSWPEFLCKISCRWDEWSYFTTFHFTPPTHSYSDQLAARLNAKLNYVPGEGGEPLLRPVEEGGIFQKYEEELEINDFPQQARSVKSYFGETLMKMIVRSKTILPIRWKVTSKEALQQISEYSEAGITVRGTYYAPGKPGEQSLPDHSNVISMKMFSGWGWEEAILGDREHSRALCAESQGESFPPSPPPPTPPRMLVSPYVLLGGDHQAVEGGVAQVEHFCYPPHQQGQIRGPVVNTRHFPMAKLIIGCLLIRFGRFLLPEHQLEQIMLFHILTENLWQQLAESLKAEYLNCTSAFSFKPGYNYMSSVSYPHLWENFHHVWIVWSLKKNNKFLNRKADIQWLIVFKEWASVKG